MVLLNWFKLTAPGTVWQTDPKTSKESFCNKATFNSFPPAKCQSAIQKAGWPWCSSFAPSSTANTKWQKKRETKNVSTSYWLWSLRSKRFLTLYEWTSINEVLFKKKKPIKGRKNNESARSVEELAVTPQLCLLNHIGFCHPNSRWKRLRFGSPG